METVSRFLLTFLLNACWQVALIAAVSGLCAWLLKTMAARYKHILWVAALCVSCGLSLLAGSNIIGGNTSIGLIMSKVAVGGPIVKPDRSMESLSVNESANELNTFQTASTSPGPVTGNVMERVINIDNRLAAIIASFYLLFLCYRYLLLARAWIKTRAIVRNAYDVRLTGRALEILNRCQNVFGVRNVRILCSKSIGVPVTIGTIKPLIVLPENLLSEIDTDMLTSALGHELVHISQLDYLFNVIYELIYIPLSFHPAAALVRRRINQNRELGCDELVTEKLLDRQVYARSLVQLAGAAVPVNSPSRAITVGINDADILEERVKNMLKAPTVRKRKLFLALGLLLIAAPCLAAAPYALRIGVGSAEVVVTSRQNVKTKILQEESLVEEKRLREEKQLQEVREHTDEQSIRDNRARELEAKRKTEHEFQARVPRGLALYPDNENDQPADERPNENLSREEEARLKALRVKEEEGLRRERLLESFDDGNDSERRNINLERRRQEEETRTRRQAELMRSAKIPMEQAIRIAKSLRPGTVMECTLGGERGQVFYRVILINSVEKETTTTLVLVNAVNGQVVKTGRE